MNGLDGKEGVFRKERGVKTPEKRPNVFHAPRETVGPTLKTGVPRPLVSRVKEHFILSHQLEDDYQTGIRRESRRFAYTFLLGATLSGILAYTLAWNGLLIGGAVLTGGILMPFALPLLGGAVYGVSDLVYRSLFTHAGPGQTYPLWVPFLGGRRRKPWF